MYILNTIKYNIFRNKNLSIISIFISTALICFMIAFLGVLIKSEDSLDSLAVATPVTGEITSPNGYYTEGLAISQLVFDRITSLDISNIEYTILLSALVEDEFISVLTANSMTDITDESFLNSSENICIVDEIFLTTQNLEIGDSINLSLYYRDYNTVDLYWSFYPMNDVSLEIVGTFNSDNLSRSIQIITPLEFTKNQITNFDEDVFYDSFSFTVTDPINLNEFKENLASKSMSPVSSGAVNSYIGRSIRLDDKLYIENAEQLMQTIDTLKMFIVPFFVLIIILIILINFFLLKNERRNIAIACSLGAKKAKITLAYFLSNTVLNVTALALITVICVLSGILSIGQIALIIALYLVCSAIGTLISLVAVLRFDVLKMLLT